MSSTSPLVIEDHGLISRAPAKNCGEISSKKPANLPGGPLTKIVASWIRFGELCPGEYIKKWTNAQGNWKYPPQDGFKLTASGKPMSKEETLKVGTVLDRFGHEGGSYLAPGDTPYSQRALPPSNLSPIKTPADIVYYKYEVAKPLPALLGPAAPWFGQKDEGMQYKVAEKIADLVSKGYLRRSIQQSVLGIICVFLYSRPLHQAQDPRNNTTPQASETIRDHLQRLGETRSATLWILE
ncbi:hypothetical protein HGRIS_000294 [Hohenbuehelia grisea]|uniref:TNT domain-containing protein n=1 Tax=Hohenbuehelia grisea TaxID=104357 RepID=A0ABR3JQT8_9AGAR